MSTPPRFPHLTPAPQVLVGILTSYDQLQLFYQRTTIPGSPPPPLLVSQHLTSSSVHPSAVQLLIFIGCTVAGDGAPALDLSGDIITDAEAVSATTALLDTRKRKAAAGIVADVKVFPHTRLFFVPPTDAGGSASCSSFSAPLSKRLIDVAQQPPVATAAATAAYGSQVRALFRSNDILGTGKFGVVRRGW